MDDLRQSLSMVMEQTAIPIELQDRKYGVRVAIIPDVELQRTAKFVLAVEAQMPGEALRARFPTQVKIGPVERIRDLVNLQLPGVTLRPLPVAPRQIPVPRRLQLLRARHAQQRPVEAARGFGRPGDAHRRRLPGPRARVLGHPRLGQPRPPPAQRHSLDPGDRICRKRHERYRTRERSLRRLRIRPHGDQAGHRSRRTAGRAGRGPAGPGPRRAAGRSPRADAGGGKEAPLALDALMSASLNPLVSAATPLLSSAPRIRAMVQHANPAGLQGGARRRHPQVRAAGPRRRVCRTSR